MSEPAPPTHTAIPLAPLPEHVAARVRRAGVKQVNLYRALAHAPRLLEGGSTSRGRFASSARRPARCAS